MWKTAASVGSAPPDPVKSDATVMPQVPVVVANKTAPGQTGPKGLSPRTTYSRVNTAPPISPPLGNQAKSLSPRGLEFLPSKVAHQENPMSYQKRPVINDLIKSAMDGTLSRIDLGEEAARQFGTPVEETKVASAEDTSAQSIPTEYCEKIASALDYIAKEAADPGSAENASPGVGPGEGPNHLQVSASNQTEENIDAGEMGEAIPQDVPPENPPMTGTEEQPAGPDNAMETNEDLEHDEQPVDPMHNENASNEGLKAASVEGNLAALAKIAGLDKEVLLPSKQASAITKATETGLKSLRKKGLNKKHLAAGAAGAAALAGGIAAAKKLKKDEAKEASPFQQHLAAIHKVAEDALNPANISAGPAEAQGAEPPVGASGSEDGPAPDEPSDVDSQKGMIASNEAAINYTKREAKADPKKDLGHLLNEPALSAAHDKTLERTLNHTNEAGAKIASAPLTKAAAAKALLLKLAKEHCSSDDAKGKKEKKAMGDLSSAEGQSGFSASNMM